MMSSLTVRLLLFVCALHWCIHAEDNDTVPLVEAAEGSESRFHNDHNDDHNDHDDDNDHNDHDSHTKRGTNVEKDVNRNVEMISSHAPTIVPPILDPVSVLLDTVVTPTDSVSPILILHRVPLLLRAICTVTVDIIVVWSTYCRNSYGQCVTYSYTPPCPSTPPCNLYCNRGYYCRLVYPSCSSGSYCPPYPQCVPQYG